MLNEFTNINKTSSHVNSFEFIVHEKDYDTMYMKLDIQTMAQKCRGVSRCMGFHTPLNWISNGNAYVK